MISSFSAQHFKSFESLELRGLRPINVIVGQSASGKTTLLEALRVGFSGQPQTLWNLLALRGVMLFVPGASREQTEALWGQYFYNFKAGSPITFQIKDDNQQSGQVAVRLDAEGQTSPVQNLPGLPPVVTGTSVLTVDRTAFNGESTTLRMHVTPQMGVQFDQGAEIGPPGEFLSATQPFNSQQAANWFSSLSIENRERPITSAVRHHFPFIEELSVQAPNGVYSLHATVEHLSRKVPISSVSGGISKFVSILLAIEQFSRGTIMIDEIENGIYYELFESFWASINSVSKNSQTQLFVTTHSLECLRALTTTIEADAERFNLIQVFQERGQSRAIVVPGEDAVAAIEMGIEVRV